MSETIISRLKHALLSVLMAVGLLLPFLGILEPSFLSPSLLFWIAGVVFLFELASFNRITAFVCFCYFNLSRLITDKMWLQHDGPRP